MRLRGFDWDEANRRKLEHHDLDADAIEDLFESGDPLVLAHPTTRGRFVALGFVPDRRFVLVVFEYDREAQWARVVTAYEPTSRKWWAKYSETKGLR